jgi:hypothetical protein
MSLKSNTRLLVGWSSRNVTPDKPVNLRGQFYMRIARAAKDPVTVTALALSAGKSPDACFIWVSCDTVAIPDKVYAQCRANLKTLIRDFPAQNLIISATHTHTAPDPDGGWYPPVPPGVITPDEYAALFSDRIAAAAAAAWKNRKPGFLAWGMGYAPIGHGRRAIYFDDLSKRPGAKYYPGMKTEKNACMYGNTADDKFDCIESYADHSTHFLFTFDARKKLIGAAIDINCTAQETEHLTEISADFWHEARVTLRKKYGQSLFVLPLCSACGGLSPHLMFNKKAKQRMLDLKGISQRQDIADRIKAAFDDTLPWAAKDLRSRADLRHVAKKVPLPVRKITPREYAQAKKDLAALAQIPPAVGDAQTRQREDSIIFSRTVRCKRIIARYEQQKKSSSWPMELHVIKLGDIALATNTFELFTDYGIRIQARSPALQTFVVQHCGNGSYLPTRQAVRGESYSACLYCNEVGPEGGDKLVEETIKTIKSMFK